MSYAVELRSDPCKALANDSLYQVLVRGAPVKFLCKFPPPEYPRVLLEPKFAQQALIVIGTEDCRRFPQMAAAALKAVFAASGKV